MLVGIRKGKVSVDFGLEDALTAATLGSLRYLPSTICTDWLGQARDRSGLPLPLGDVSTGLMHEWLHLWPHFDLDGATVEPDAVIDLPDHCIILEVKLRSGKSQTPSTGIEGAIVDQLARQWTAVRRSRERQGRNPLEPAVVLVTPHAMLPEEDLMESENAISQQGRARAPVFWVSWSALARVLRSTGTGFTSRERILVEDILNYMARALPGGAMPFDGWAAAISGVPPDKVWRYQHPAHRWFRVDPTAALNAWRYTAAQWFGVVVETAGRAAEVWRYKVGEPCPT